MGTGLPINQILQLKKKLASLPAKETEMQEMSVQEQVARKIESLIVDLQGPDGKNPSREVALAVTKLQEARFWLMADYSA